MPRVHHAVVPNHVPSAPFWKLIASQAHVGIVNVALDCKSAAKRIGAHFLIVRKRDIVAFAKGLVGRRRRLEISKFTASLETKSVRR